MTQVTSASQRLAPLFGEIITDTSVARAAGHHPGLTAAPVVTFTEAGGVVTAHLDPNGGTGFWAGRHPSGPPRGRGRLPHLPGGAPVIHHPDAMTMHPLMHPDPDVGCRWFCETAGCRTAKDEAMLASVTQTLPFEGQPLPASYFPDPSTILERVR